MEKVADNLEDGEGVRDLVLWDARGATEGNLDP